MPNEFINQSQLAGTAPKAFGAGGLLAIHSRFIGVHRSCLLAAVACSALFGD